MLKNFLKTNFRALWKSKAHALINIAGLSLGISCAIIIFITVRFELSFDNYHANSDRVYRIVTERNKFGEVGYDAGITYPMPEALRQDFPDLEYVTITDVNISDPVIGITDRKGARSLFKQSKFVFADPEYFKIFSYEWLEGNPDQGLTAEKSVVLAESVARKFFGDEPALNQIISFNGKFDLTVSGVVRDAPLNSDLPFVMFISNRLGADKHSWDNWGSTSSGINCYVRLKEGVQAADFQNKMKGWHMKYFTGDDKVDGEATTFFLQPLAEVHFDTRFTNYNSRVMSTSTLWALSLIGGLLLLTACINFINLNTVLIINRAREVGVRKVLGSGRFQLVAQFLGETFLITLISLMLSMGLVEFALLNLSPVLGYQLEFNFLSDGLLALFIFSLPLLVTLLAGLYPAMSLASFQPIKALKSKMYEGPIAGVTLRRVLIAFQLMISQALVISTIIIVQQLDFFTHQPLGLNSSAVVEFELPENKSVDLRALKDRLQSIPGVLNVNMSNTGSTSVDSWGGDFTAKVDGKVVQGSVKVKFADEDYINTYQLKLLEGRDLVRSDTVNLFVVNEAFVQALGLKEPSEAIGVHVEIWGRKALVQGVVKNYHTTSFHDAIPPVAIMVGARNYYKISARLQTEDASEVMGRIEQTWKDAFPNYVFEYSFLDDTIRNFYRAERRTSGLISIFAVVAILIGCIGLLGLVSFMVTKRTKEVGIRKTLGASVSSIMSLFSKEFVILIVISFMIAAPAASYFMGLWLDNFAYHILPGVATYLTAVGLSLLVVLASVGYISYSAAVSNPVDALKCE